MEGAAPCVFDGAINGERFRAYVEQRLAPTLRSDDIVLLDNLSSHKIAGIEQAITAQGARLVYLPPYSPDLNPSRPSPNSRLRCARPQGAPAKPSGRLSAERLTSTRCKNAETLQPGRLSKLIRNRSRSQMKSVIITIAFLLTLTSPCVPS